MDAPSDSPPRPRPDRPVYFILHVPKCAGSTVEAHLMRHMAPGRFVRPGKRRSVLRHVTTRYLPGDVVDPDGIEALSGHHIGRSLEARFAGREVRRTVLLREPLGFFLSYYNFRMMRYLKAGWRTYDFATANRSLPRNPVADFLLGAYLEMPWARRAAMPDREKYERLNDFLATCWFVGGHVRCDDLIAALAPELGVPATAERANTGEDWQRKVDWTPLRADDLDAQTKRRIDDDNPVDRLLWESWRDARHATAAVRPAAFPGGGMLAPLAHELSRPVFEVRRRLQRGWW